MKVKLIGEPKIIMSNPDSLHNYFAWPSVARLQNGKIAAVSSGYRMEHVCPFGKAVVSYSEDEGETYTMPAPIIDTVLDDRDAGIATFGESGVIMTSFNLATDWWDALKIWGSNSYIKEYVEMIPKEKKEAVLASNFCFSYDYGVTFGELYKAPVTSPHGPIQLQDGTILWVGKKYVSGTGEVGNGPVQACILNLDGTTEIIGEIPLVYEGEEQLLYWEPNAVQLQDGTILCHIRAHQEVPDFGTVLLLYQSESTDGGKTWSVPHKIEGIYGGAPAHIIQHSSGVVISAYGFRLEHPGVRIMLSYDNGKTWDVEHMLFETEYGNGDLGYPATVELSDGSLLTVFYAYASKEGPAVIMQQKWEIVGK